MPFGEARTLGFNNQPVNKVIAGAVTLDKTGLTIKNSHGATIFKVEVSKDAWFLYKDTGTTTQGTLIASGAAGTGTDDFGNAFVAAVAAYATLASGIGAGRYAVQLADQTAPYGNNAAFSIQNLTNPANVPPGLLVNIDTTDGNIVEILSGKKTAAATQSSIELLDSIFNGICTIDISADRIAIVPVANTAAICEVNGDMLLDSLTAAPAQSVNGSRNYADTTGYSHTKSARTGDANSYIYGKICTYNPNDQLINSLTFADVLSSLTAIGAGKYRVTGRITVVQGPNVAANGFRLGFTGTITQVRARLRQIQDNTSGFLATTTSNNGLLASHAFGAATTYDAELTAIINTSSTGNISIQAACQTAAANTFTVLAASDFLIEPIG